MLLLGLVLLGATGAFAGLLIAYNTAGPDYTVTMFGHTLGTLNSLQVFLAGIALTLVFCLGLAMMFGGASMHRRHRAERLAARREAAAARAERDALAARLDSDHAYANDTSTLAPTPDASPRAEMDPESVSATPTTRRRNRMPHVFGH